jgi:hypothetical protein
MAATWPEITTRQSIIHFLHQVIPLPTPLSLFLREGARGFVLAPSRHLSTSYVLRLTSNFLHAHAFVTGGLGVLTSPPPPLSFLPLVGGLK